MQSAEAVAHARGGFERQSRRLMRGTNRMKSTITPLPPAAELHEYVRASVPRKGNVPPPAFVEAKARVDDLESQLEAARERMQSLVREAHEQGAPQSTLARWAGYSHRWVSIILQGGGS